MADSQKHSGILDIDAFDALIDAYQCAQKDGTLNERADARAALKKAYRAALFRAQTNDLSGVTVHITDSIPERLAALLADAERAGLNIRVWNEPLAPLAMGHHTMRSDVYPARYPVVETHATRDESDCRGEPFGEDGPDEDGFKGPRPWNGFQEAKSSQQRPASFPDLIESSEAAWKALAHTERATAMSPAFAAPYGVDEGKTLKDCVARFPVKYSTEFPPCVPLASPTPTPQTAQLNAAYAALDAVCEWAQKDTESEETGAGPQLLALLLTHGVHPRAATGEPQ
jgi:hypothetical protein